MLAASSPDLAWVCLFSLLGLTLTAAILSYFSTETLSMIFSSIGRRGSNGLTFAGSAVRGVEQTPKGEPPKILRGRILKHYIMESRQILYFLTHCKKLNFMRATKRVFICAALGVLATGGSVDAQQPPAAAPSITQAAQEKVDDFEKSFQILNVPRKLETPMLN